MFNNANKGIGTRLTGFQFQSPSLSQYWYRWRNYAGHEESVMVRWQRTSRATPHQVKFLKRNFLLLLLLSKCPCIQQSFALMSCCRGRIERLAVVGTAKHEIQPKSTRRITFLCFALFNYFFLHEEVNPHSVRPSRPTACPSLSRSLSHMHTIGDFYCCLFATLPPMPEHSAILLEIEYPIDNVWEHMRAWRASCSGIIHETKKKRVNEKKCGWMFSIWLSFSIEPNVQVYNEI